jgi:hypothetical protein
VVSTTDSYGRILGFLDRSRYFFFEVAPQLYSRGWVDPVPDPLFLRKSGNAGNRTRTSGSVARNSDHCTTDWYCGVVKTEALGSKEASVAHGTSPGWYLRKWRISSTITDRKMHKSSKKTFPIVNLASQWKEPTWPNDPCDSRVGNAVSVFAERNNSENCQIAILLIVFRCSVKCTSLHNDALNSWCQ